MARVAEVRLGDFNVQNLVNTAWGFATSQSDAQLFAALSRAAHQCRGDFDAFELANTAWAITIVSHWDALMFMSRALSNVDRQGAKWAVAIAGSSITKEPNERSPEESCKAGSCCSCGNGAWCSRKLCGLSGWGN